MTPFSNVTLIPRDICILRQPADHGCNAKNGHAATGDCCHSPRSLGYNCPPSEYDASVSAPAVSHNDVSAIHTCPSKQDSGIHSQDCSESLEVLDAAFDSAPPSLLIPGEKLPRHRPDLGAGVDADEAHSFSTCDDPGDATPAMLTHRASNPPYTIYGVHHDRYECATQKHAEDELRLGGNGRISRWHKGSVLKYMICAETFDNPDWAAVAAGAAGMAVSMWQSIGVRFEQVYRDSEATFGIKYSRLPESRCRDVYARAFFPQEAPGEIYIYQFALEGSNANHLANILAHELGHVLGLRHEFAHWRTSVLWGEKNPQSIMNYFDHPSKLKVGEQDRRELAAFYEYEQGEYEGQPVTDLAPPLKRFPRRGSWWRKWRC